MTTVADLILQVRELCDHVNSAFVTDAEILRMLQGAHQDLYSQIVRLNESYFVISAALNINAETIALPTDCMKVNGIDLNINNRTVTLRRFNFSERNKYDSASFQCYAHTSNMRYNIINQSIRFMPKPNASYTGTIWYTPYPTALTIGGSVDFPVAHYDGYLINTAVVQVLAKEERSTSFWKNEADEAMKMALMNIPCLDQSEPDSVTDIYNMNTIEY